MSLKSQITEDIKAAMKAQDTVKKSILRVIKAEISREEGGLKDLDDTGVIKLIKKNIKSLEEIGSEDALAEKAVLDQYMPKQMSEAEIEQAISAIVSQSLVPGQKHEQIEKKPNKDQKKYKDNSKNE